MGGALSLEPILMEYLTVRGHQESDGVTLGAFDTLMEHVVRGVVENVEDIDIILLGAMAEGWSIDRLDSVLRAVLRAGAYEMGWDEDTPGPVIINEYVNITRTFFSEGTGFRQRDAGRYSPGDAQRTKSLGLSLKSVLFSPKSS